LVSGGDSVLFPRSGASVCARKPQRGRARAPSPGRFASSAAQRASRTASSARLSPPVPGRSRVQAATDA